MSLAGSVRARVTLLLAASVVLVLLLAAIVMGRQTLEPGSAMLARMVLHEVGAAPGGDDPFAPLTRTDAPPADIPDSPLARALVDRIAAELGDPERVRFSRSEPRRVWIRGAAAGASWTGVAVEPLRRPVLRASVTILLIAGVLVIALGTWLSRQLTRPLDALAERADAIVGGGEVESEAVDELREVAQLRAALLRAAGRLRTAQVEREQLLAGVSHDLRTPLSRLRFATELGDSADAAAREAMIADIEEMDALIGEFIALTRQQAAPQVAPVDLAALLGEVAEAWRPQGEVRLELDPTPPLSGDRLALRRALGNLVANAFRHGAPPVTIALSAAAGVTTIAVSDQGRPVPSDADSTRGYGLGLSIVQAIARQHGGEVVLESLPEGGLRATLRLRGAPSAPCAP